MVPSLHQRHLYASGMAILVFALFISCSPNRSKPPETKAWTVLLYDDADFELIGDPCQPFSRAIPSGPQVNTLILQDRWQEPAILWRVDENGELEEADHFGEVSMGSGETLNRFLRVAKSKYPAHRYMLCFYDHGGAWQGCCWDEASDYDVLTMDEIQAALHDQDGVDLIMYTAPCRMGSLESAYELRNETDVIIASENWSVYIYWMRPMPRIGETLHANPDIGPHELAQMIIPWIWEGRALPDSILAGYSDELTMSAVRTDHLDALQKAIDDISALYLNDVPVYKAFIDSAYKDIMNFSEDTGLVDIASLFSKLLEVETSPSRRTLLQNVISRLEEAVIARCNGAKWQDAGGLTLYHPDPDSGFYNHWYGNPNLGLDFPADTHWDDLLEAVFQGQRSKMKSNQMPPHLRTHDPFQGLPVLQ